MARTPKHFYVVSEGSTSGSRSRGYRMYYVRGPGGGVYEEYDNRRDASEAAKRLESEYKRRIEGNPRATIPAKWTVAKVRVNQQGKVQIAINPRSLRGTTKRRKARKR